MKDDHAPLIEIDAGRCRRDFLCAAVCPGRLIAMGDDGPVAVEDAAQRCVDCGHCVSVCPVGALTHRSMSPGDCERLPDGWRIPPERLAPFLKARRSIRTFKQRPVDRDTLAAIIDLTRYAPSGLNRQPVKWLVVNGRVEIRRLLDLVVDWMRTALTEHPAVAKGFGLARLVAEMEAGRDVISRDAPHLLVAHADQGDPTAPGACLIALSHLEIAALSYDVGTCWAGYFMMAAPRSAPLQAALGLPEGHLPYGAMMIGHPKFAYHRIPRRQPAEIRWR